MRADMREKHKRHVGFRWKYRLTRERERDERADLMLDEKFRLYVVLFSELSCYYSQLAVLGARPILVVSFTECRACHFPTVALRYIIGVVRW